MKKLLFLLPVLLLLFNQRDNSVLLVNERIIAYADTVRIYPDTLKTGHFQGRNANKTTARDLTTATGGAYLTAITTGIDSNKSVAGVNTFQPAFLAFAIPALTSKPTSGVLRLYGSSKQVKTDTLYNIFASSQARSGGLTTTDYPKYNGHQATGAYNGTKLADDWNTSSYSAGVNTITLNSAGLDSVYATQGDTLFISLLNLRHYFDTWVVAPTDTISYLTFKTARQVEKAAGIAAHLWIEYSAASTEITGRYGRVGHNVNIARGEKW